MQLEHWEEYWLVIYIYIYAVEDGAEERRTGVSALPRHEQYKLMYQDIEFRG